MKTKNKPSILELTVSIFLCLDLPGFVPWGGGGFFFQMFFVISENFPDKNGTILFFVFASFAKTKKFLNFDV